MSRVTKISSRHQSTSNICSIRARPRQLKGVTTSEQADQHRASYRAKCDTRRNGKTLETLDENGGWALQQTFPFINKAKAASSSRRYAV